MPDARGQERGGGLTGGVGEGETGRQGDRERGRLGDQGTGRLRNGVKKLTLDLNPTRNYNVITDS